MKLTLILLTCILVQWTASVYGNILNPPDSKVTFQGSNATFTCTAEGNVFWRINGTIYDYRYVRLLAKRGFIFTEEYDDQRVEKTITVVSSLMINNNTRIECVAINSSTDVPSISEEAVLTVIGVPADLTLTELVDGTMFEITWGEVYTPADQRIQTYTVQVVDASGQEIHSRTVDATDDGTYSFTFDATDFVGTQPPPDCTQFVFLVTANNPLGRSQPARVSWETPKALSPIERIGCSISSAQKVANVYFTIESICSFQTLNYDVSVLEGRSDRAIATFQESVSGGDGVKFSEGVPLNALESQKQYSIVVSISASGAERAVTKTTPCFANAPVVGALGAGSVDDSDNFNSGLIAAIVVCALVALLVIILNIVAISVVIIRWNKQLSQ